MTDKADIVGWLNSLTCEDKDCDGRGTRHIPGYAGEKISLGCDWCDTRSATLSTIASQAAEIEKLYTTNTRFGDVIASQAAEIDALKAENKYVGDGCLITVSRARSARRRSSWTPRRQCCAKTASLRVSQCFPKIAG